MQERSLFQTQYTADSAVAVNKVIKNTYMLLALTLTFSAFTAFLSRDFAPISPWVFLGGTIGLSLLTQVLARSAWGLLAVFAFTGFIGFALGPILAAIMHTPMGSALVMQALGGTAIIFLALSGYALVSRKDFSFLQGFLFAGGIVLMIAVVAGLFLKIPALYLAMDVGFMLFASAAILFQTGAIIHGGERNYILATVTLFASIFNLFMSLLNLLMAFSGNNR
jgi:modulator of FtsH protease